MDIYNIVKKYVDEYDFECLLAAHAPKDEYDNESLEISQKINVNSSVLDIAETFSDVFSRSMGSLSKVDVNNADSFIEIATKIRGEIDGE